MCSFPGIVYVTQIMGALHVMKKGQGCAFRMQLALFVLLKLSLIESWSPGGLRFSTETWLVLLLVGFSTETWLVCYWLAAIGNLELRRQKV